MTATLRLSLLLYAVFLNALSNANVDISTQLETTATYYTPGEKLPMVLTLKNSGTEGYTVKEIKTDWLSLEVMDVEGKLQKAFTAIAVSAEVKKKPGDTTSTAGTFTPTTDIDITDAHLEPGVEITYHIDLVVNEHVLSPLSLYATYEDEKTNTVNIPPGVLDFALTKTANVSEYTPGQSITYTVRLDNKGQIPLLDVTVKDLISKIQGTDMAGNPIAAFSSIQSITATADSTASNTGSFSTTGPDLDVTSAKVAVDGWISYDIKATVASTLVSPITNSSTANTFGISKSSSDLTLDPVAEEITLDYSVSHKSNYKPSQALTYSLKVSNTGGGFALNYSVQNSLKTLSINLANNGDTSVYDHTDINGHPFTEWTVTVKSVGSNSLSSLGQGKVLTNDDLNDTVTIAPGEDISYEIKATTKPEAISPIHTEASTTPKSGTSPITQTLDLTANALTDTVTVVKKPVNKQYEPGGWVTYTITATNTDNTKFADNFTIKDQISSCETVTLADGSSGAPFTAWKLSVDSSEGDGTDPGLFSYGVNQTDDINITADFSPAGKVIYKLDAQVNPQATGTILDTGPCPDDNVTEEGAGIDAPQGKAEVLKFQ